MDNTTSHITSGIRKVLESPIIYQSFQSLVGANKLYRKFINDYVEIMNDDHILDIGCGPGKMIEFFPKDIDWNYSGIDLNEEYIKSAKKAYSSLGNFYVGALDPNYNFSFDSNFDKAYAFALLHHIGDETIINLLSELSKILKKGGVFISIDPTFTKNQSAIAKKIISLDRGQNVKTPQGYKEIVSKVFSKVEVTVLDNFINIPYNHCIIKAYNE